MRDSLLAIYFLEHRYSTCSSDSSTMTKCNTENQYELARKCSKWKAGLVYLMDPCIEDCKLYGVNTTSINNHRVALPVTRFEFCTFFCSVDISVIIVPLTFVKATVTQKKKTTELKSGDRQLHTILIPIKVVR